MTRGLTAVVAASLVCAAPATAQRAGAVEVGALVRVSNLDNSFGTKRAFALGVGGRTAVSLRPRLVLELDISRTSAALQSGSGSATYTPVHVRLVGTVPAGARVEALVGGGYVHNSYGAPVDAGDNGLSGLLGLRYRATNRLWLRAGLDLDIMFHPSSDSRFVFYTGNWGLHFGGDVPINP